MMQKTLYHYTDSAVLTSIIEKRAIRLSARWHLNDPREGLDFVDLMGEYAGQDEEKRGRLEHALSIFDAQKIYVACFSGEGDLLSQWRGYASDGTGVSIGFDHQRFRDLLKSQTNALIREVAYADNLADAATSKDLYQAIETVFTHGGSPKSDVVQSLAKIHWAVKRKAYSEEREFRLIYNPANLQTAPISIGKTTISRKFVGLKSELRDYCEMEFQPDDLRNLITEIYLGPKNRSNEQVVMDYLEANDLSNTKVLRSAAHYR